MNLRQLAGSQQPADSAREIQAALRASGAITRASDPRAAVPTFGAAMNDPTAAGLLGLLAKLAPAGIGAAIMVMVDPPQSRRELFARLFVAFAFSYLFGDVMFDFAKSFHLFAFLDAAKRTHVIAVEGLAGAAGWFVMGGAAQLLKRFKADPMGAVNEVKRGAP